VLGETAAIVLAVAVGFAVDELAGVIVAGARLHFLALMP